MGIATAHKGRYVLRTRVTRGGAELRDKRQRYSREAF
jgi:hypothetical protein